MLAISLLNRSHCEKLGRCTTLRIRFGTIASMDISKLIGFVKCFINQIGWVIVSIIVEGV